MNADEIRKLSIPVVDTDIEKIVKEKGLEVTKDNIELILMGSFQLAQLTFLREIAAQIAEFNERCQKNCTPPQNETRIVYDKKPRLPVGVSILMRDRAGKLLLGKRMGGKTDGVWSTPGGRIEEHESIEACASRESYEETGLVLKENRFVQMAFKEHFRYNDHYFMVYVTTHLDHGEALAIQNTEPDKHGAWQWFETYNLPKPCTEPEDILKRL
jgi:8-oxo-dGTP diphosphatase